MEDMAKQMKDKFMQGQAKFEEWQKEQQANEKEQAWEQFKHANKGKTYTRADFEKLYSEGKYQWSNYTKQDFEKMYKDGFKGFQ